MKKVKTLVLFCFTAGLMIIGFSLGCKDIGSEPPTLQSPLSTLFSFRDTTFAIPINTSISVLISGGTPPYTVIMPHDTMKVKVIVSGNSLTIAARSSFGRDTIVIEDSSTPKLRDTAGVIIYSISYSGLIQPIFDQRCATSGCHAPGGVAPFSLQANASYGALLNQPATRGPCLPIFRVKPGSADSSALYLRIEGRCGQQMPLGGGGLLPVPDRSNIRTWINEGALPN